MSLKLQSGTVLHLQKSVYNTFPLLRRSHSGYCLILFDECGCLTTWVPAQSLLNVQPKDAEDFVGPKWTDAGRAGVMLEICNYFGDVVDDACGILDILPGGKIEEAQI